MKNLLILFVLSFLGIQLSAQTFELPKKYKLESKSDYGKYEQEVINAVDWLINTPINLDKEKRTEVNAFLLKWLTGSPSVSIGIDPNIVTFTDCGDCLMIFMGGWAKYVLETKDNTDKVKANLAGLESVITFYQKQKAELGDNKAVEKYIKLKGKDKLHKFVESKI
ncbi:MAG: hypothetical protein R8P61_37210 [Bacteroidia bacterium]|nr:hypothetical protein [Bacteroidia bacterium]